MTAGIQTWSQNGAKTLDTSDRLSRVLGVRAVNPADGLTGSLTDDGFYQGTPFFIAQPSVPTTSPDGKVHYIATYLVVINVSGNTLTWTFPSSGNPQPINIVYGVF